MSEPPEDDDRPAQPAYGPSGRPPPPGTPPYRPTPTSGDPPYGQPSYGQQYWHPQYTQYAQPPYAPYAGQPYPYPPGYGAPPVERRRSRPAWVLLAVVVVAVAVAAVLSFTLRTRVLDRFAVERDVATQFRQHEGVAIRLDCADSMVLTTGATYRCRGTTADGEKVTLLIRVTDARTARYTWSEQR